MERRAITCLALTAALLASPVRAQLGGGLPIDPLGTVGRVGDAVRDVAAPTLAPLGEVVGDVRRLARERAQRLARFVSDNDGRVEWDEYRQPAVCGEALLLDPDPAALELARRRGFVVIEQGTLEALDVGYARLAVPPGAPLARAIETLREALPGREVTADQLHFPSGSTRSAAKGTAKSGVLPRGGTVGVIDGAIAGSKRVVSQRSFAAGSKPSDHASAIASLLTGAGTENIYGADVYGSDPAGGNALAIAKAIGWMLGQGVPVVSISLVGPSNPLLARAVAAAQAKGVVIVAAVGNDGAAAPPAYPASYPGVVAVTGIDGAGRVLIEAGRATHLDYAAPGADMSALLPGRGRVTLRGTSYAAPLAASRIAARRAVSTTSAEALKAADAEALKPSSRTGRGVLCNICRSGL
ncbi:S8 family serine peptidase [Novosphingobium sp. AP12]|uniref:S8 family serine peptidase n=1 Tax=Novosphingobium sp. AP12 TaxID=1144305 RepID=UPI000271FB2E|nr:S8 family serine peptidase [Novosphingobium sp. AP12]EJL28931.1 subtilisin-like serine protease [Novosphingobium sp. AP12]